MKYTVISSLPGEGLDNITIEAAAYNVDQFQNLNFYSEGNDENPTLTYVAGSWLIVGEDEKYFEQEEVKE